MTDALLADPAPPAGPRIWALVPCAGTGSRAGTGLPKQYQPLAGQALVQHTLAAFAATPEVHATLVVLAETDRIFETLKPRNASFSIANCGGSTRAMSVLNGLNALLASGAGSDDWVLVHDAARCLITPTQIEALIAACRRDDVGGLLALPLADTLKAGRGGRVANTLPRADKWLAQTPQMFRIGTLKKALAHAGPQVTDESSALEAMGLRPKLVEGSAQNFKVTYPADFALAQAILVSRKNARSIPRDYDYP
jgi:2-C-methyl-D-erythritol 4-phosphate cytidylyltransferase